MYFTIIMWHLKAKWDFSCYVQPVPFITCPDNNNNIYYILYSSWVNHKIAYLYLSSTLEGQ